MKFIKGEVFDEQVERIDWFLGRKAELERKHIVSYINSPDE
jgi:hypothetical protein